MKLEFFTPLCIVFGLFGKVHMDFSNNSGHSSSGSSNDTMVLNNMLAREILKRQALENKVTTLERQIQSLVTDVATTKTTYMGLQHAVEGISLRQNNMAGSLQTITQRLDSESDDIKQRLRSLSNITNRIQISGGHGKYNLLWSSRPRGAVVRAEEQRSDDPCVPRSNPTVGRW
jgi:hypothetical protein